MIQEQSRFQYGLTGNTIKIIGVVMMIFDHLHQMFHVQGVPLWFGWIGRPVLPIFVFLCAEGFAYTRSRKRYLLQLFIGFEFMNIVSEVLSLTMWNEDVILINNVFQTLLLAALYMLFIEILRSGIREKQAGKITAAVLLMLLPIAVGIGFLLIIESGTRWMFMVFRLIPNIFATEGGFTAILMGIVFYLLRKHRLWQVAAFAVICVLSLVMFLKAGNSPLSGSAQWLMIFALVPIVLYNGQRGKGSKYFFYIFYPVHIYALYIIAWFMR
ncbi:membrane protein [Spirochaetia bacterium]|nr:membrane protein [Spirochaetia bacterium]